jgi:hypothetical protein
MKRRSKIVAVSLGSLALLSAGAAAYVLREIDEVQPFYAAAIQADPQELETAGRRAEDRVEALREDAKRRGRWETVFTDEEVNGWLAVILEEKYAELLPSGVTDPRVAFTPGGCQIGYRYQGRRIDAVVSVEGDAYMDADDMPAVRLRAARFGGLPLPMSRVVEEISASAAKLKIPIRWSEQEGDPVLLASVADALSTDDERRQLERLELRDGELLLAGRAEPLPKPTKTIAKSSPAAAGR